MRAAYLLSVLLVFALYSCESAKTKQYKKDIIGEWSFARTVDLHKPKNNEDIPPPPPPPMLSENYKKGYVFYGNGECEYKLGYGKIIYEKDGERKTAYLGNQTTYKIENDSLMVFSLADSTWKNEKIYSITNDTLTLQESDSVFNKYFKPKYNIDPNETYDKIIVSSSGCFGSCPISNTSIDKNGDILFFGENFTFKNGLFTSKIPPEAFQKIMTSFKKAGIDTLDEHYSANWTDDQTISITFIKNNRIYKTISDYGMQSPPELIWAYLPVMFLNQHIKLTPYIIDNQILKMWRISFETSDRICDLEKSEDFLLKLEILKGKNVAQQFNKTYKIEYWENENIQQYIYTDGRYYQFQGKTIDIGYNFLIENKLIDKFRKKNEYD